MKIAYCQIGVHPSFVGPYGAYCKEPFIDESGPLLTTLKDQNIKEICEKIDEKYHIITRIKIGQILKSLRGKGVECLVFPEYSVPATSLDILYDFAQSENCICVAASHSIQGIYKEIYESINLNINLDSTIGMSCCPVILPSKTSIAVLKKYKSKWETNMKVGEEEYAINNGVAYIPYNGHEQIAVVICIDALKTDIDSKKAKLVVVPAATPSMGPFNNKFESYLAKDIPSVFCNHYQYGGSTIFCHAPKQSNIPFADATKFIPMTKYEEAVALADIDIYSHTLTVKSSNTKCLAAIKKIIPIYYRENTNSLGLMDKVAEAIRRHDYKELLHLINLFDVKNDGLLAEYKNYLYENIKGQSLSFDQITSWVDYIYINEFSLMEYEKNWVEKASMLIQNYIMEGQLSFNEKIQNVQKRLYEANSYLKKSGLEKYDIPVFEDNTNDDSTFQNRGGEIQQFKEVHQETEKTIFLINGFASIGKSAFVRRLKYLYSFNIIEKTLTKSSGFESFLRLLCDITKMAPTWNDLDEEELNYFAVQISQRISEMNKKIIVIKTTGNIFDDYNLGRTSTFINLLADNLGRLKTRIKVIIEISRTIPPILCSNPNIHICKLKPLLPLYIERLIEQTATKVTFDISLPTITREVVEACKGNPQIAVWIGVYLGKKINEKNDRTLSITEINDIAYKQVDGILETLRINESQKIFIQDMSIFRMPVKKSAFENLPSYKKEIFTNLIDNMIIDNEDNLYVLNPLIHSRYNRKSDYSELLHKIAAEYYNNEFQLYHESIDKAEYFYHISFCDPKLKEKELRYFADEILTAAIALCDGSNTIEIKRINMALSHLNSIKHWRDKYWKYNLYVAYCKILLDDYQGYQEAFELAISIRKDSPIIVYLLMARKLIKARKFTEAENLLNIIEDLYGPSKQLSALWVMLRYSNNNTRREAIEKAIMLTKTQKFDIHASKILVPILLREGLTENALDELNSVLKIWNNNEWARTIKYRIQTGKYDIDNDEDDVTEESEE